jgi:hypothetical protein
VDGKVGDRRASGRETPGYITRERGESRGSVPISSEEQMFKLVVSRGDLGSWPDGRCWPRIMQFNKQHPDAEDVQARDNGKQER